MQSCIRRLSIFQTGVSQETECGCLAFILSQIVGRCCQRSLKPTEKHCKLELRACPRNELITVVGAIQIQKLILPAQNLATLIEFSAVHTDVFILQRFRHHDSFPWIQRDSVHTSKCIHKGNDHGCATAQPADGKRNLDHSRNAVSQWQLLMKLQCCATHMVSPVSDLLFRDTVRMKLCPLGGNSSFAAPQRCFSSGYTRCGFPYRSPDRCFYNIDGQYAHQEEKSCTDRTSPPLEFCHKSYNRLLRISFYFSFLRQSCACHPGAHTP